ncbi:MAG TPA: serine O-acetyltransferase [Porticoccaceae bacterium]|nr:serine O-acetyltransferase [Porticoccaceae bacterium]
MHDPEYLWNIICDEARELSQQEPLLHAFFEASVLSHQNLASAVIHRLATALDQSVLQVPAFPTICATAVSDDADILRNFCRDLEAYVARDAACDRYILPLLYFKGYPALQLQRICHWLWGRKQRILALFLHSKMTENFAVDIHPGAKIGGGIMLDHATGLVIGETAVVGDNVSILHSVSLGGSGVQRGDRHPKIGHGVLIAAGAKILGNVTVGDGVKVGAGSLVLESVPPHVTVAGVPARVVGVPQETLPALEMDQYLDSNDA